MSCILAALDFGKDTTRVFDQAKRLANSLQADLILTTVANEDHSPKHPIYELEADCNTERLNCRALVLQGEIAHEVLACSEEVDAEILVIGSCGNSSIHDILSGSAGPDILQNSKRPVLVVPPQ